VLVSVVLVWYSQYSNTLASISLLMSRSGIVMLFPKPVTRLLMVPDNLIVVSGILNVFLSQVSKVTVANIILAL
jgi:hypothetical protein